MRPEDIQPTVNFIKEEILNGIHEMDLMSENERRRFFTLIEQTLEEFGLEASEMLSAEVAETYAEELVIAMGITTSLGIGYRDSLGSLVHTSALENMLMDSMLDMQAAIRTAKMTSINSIDTALTQVRNDLASGIMLGTSRNQIVQRVADSFEKNGLKAFYTIDGKALPLDFYSETITRTKISKARSTAHANHYEEASNEHFSVIGNYDTCQECASYRDIIFTMTGEDDRFTYLDPREALPFHPNCKCVITPVVLKTLSASEIEREAIKSKQFDPSIDKRTKKQREAYESDQRAKVKARNELKQYQRAVALLGDDAPKTLGAYRRMKRGNTRGYRELQRKLRSARAGSTAVKQAKAFDLLDFTPSDAVQSEERIKEVINRAKPIINNYKSETGIDILELRKNKQFHDKNNPYDDEHARFTKYMMNQLGYDGLPQKIEDTTGLQDIYRGVVDTPDGSITAKEFVNRFKNGEMDISGARKSAYGRGIYFGEYRDTAESYASENNGEVITAYMMKDIKLLDAKNIRSDKELFNDIRGNLSDAEMYELVTGGNWFMDKNHEMLAMLHGYDGIKDDNGFLNIFNRTKLGVKK